MSPTDHEQNIEKTFRVSYQQLDVADDVDETALYILARAACLAPNVPIPDNLLLTSSSQFKPSDDQKNEALRRILELGLLEAEDDGLVLHLLLSQFIRKANRDATHQDNAQTDIEIIIEQQARKLNDTGFPARLLPLQPHLYHVTKQALVRRDFRQQRFVIASAIILFCSVIMLERNFILNKILPFDAKSLEENI